MEMAWLKLAQVAFKFSPIVFPDNRSNVFGLNDLEVGQQRGECGVYIIDGLLIRFNLGCLYGRGTGAWPGAQSTGVITQLQKRLFVLRLALEAWREP